MSATDNDRTARPFTGRHMLLLMIAFFGVIIAVNLTMAWFASTSWTGLIVKNGYVASQHYNERLAQAREQRARGWEEFLTYEANRLGMEIKDSDGSPVILEQLVASVGRPASEFADRQVSFDYVGGGRYLADLVLDGGIWRIEIVGSGIDGPFRLEARLFVRENGAGILQ